VTTSVHECEVSMEQGSAEFGFRKVWKVCYCSDEKFCLILHWCFSSRFWYL